MSDNKLKFNIGVRESAPTTSEAKPMIGKPEEILQQVRNIYINRSMELFKKASTEGFKSLDSISSHENKVIAENASSFIASKNNLVKAMENQLNELINESFNGNKITFKGSSNKLSLVANDKLEEDILISELCKMAMGDAAEMAEHTYLRIKELMKLLGTESTFDPLHANVFGMALSHVVKEFTQNNTVRKAFFKSFESTYFKNYFFILSDMNELMISKNVMSDLKQTLEMSRRNANKDTVFKKEELKDDNKPASRNSSVLDKVLSSSPSELTKQDLNLDEDYITDIDPDQIESALKKVVAEAKNKGIIDDVNKPGYENKDEISQSEMVSVLTNLQNKIDVVSNLDLDNDKDREIAKKKVREMISEEVNEHQDKKIGQLDEESINTIGLMFEYILDDIALPAELKTLMVRLQIPFLKVAMVDNTFFKRGDHSARKLLNIMAKAGATISSSKSVTDEPVYEKIETVINKIISEYATNIDIFDQYFEEFNSYANKFLSKVQSMIDRTAKSSEGSEKILEAHTVVISDLKEILSDDKTPIVLKLFCKESWSKIMQNEYMNNGRSVSYQGYIDSIFKLSWSISEDRVEEHTKVADELREVMKDVRNTLNLKGINMMHTQEHLVSLEAMQDRICQGQSPNGESSNLGKKKSLMEAMTFIRDDEAKESTESDLEEWIESSYLTDKPEISDEWLSKFKVGRWISFEETNQRLKIGVVLKFKRKIVLVNDKGIKQREMEVDELICKINDKNAKLFEDDKIFERAMNSVFKRLKG